MRQGVPRQQVDVAKDTARAAAQRDGRAEPDAPHVCARAAHDAPRGDVRAVWPRLQEPAQGRAPSAHQEQPRHGQQWLGQRREQHRAACARPLGRAEQDRPPHAPFVVLDLLGQGTFGQVFRCQDVDSKELVAIKIIRNHPSYYKQALVEIHVSMLLSTTSEIDGFEHVVQMHDHFMFQNHLCLVFELLSINLYELISQNSFRGLPLTVVRGFLIQILKSLVLLGRTNIIHCDLKPENILLSGTEQTFSITDATSRRQVPKIKLVDFGSACYEDETVYSYIQSRFYRSPEVLLGLPYNGAIDMWSLGCISVEIFLGLPLFPGVSDHDQLRLIVETIGPPPSHMLAAGRNVRRFYHRDERGVLRLKTPDEYAAETQTPRNVSKRYFKHSVLDDIIHAYPIPRSASSEECEKEVQARHVFCHFLRGLLVVDPAVRWTPEQALAHPFVTGDAFEPSFEPPREYVRPRYRPPMAFMPPPQWAGYYSAPRNIPRADPYYPCGPVYPHSCPMPDGCHPMYYMSPDYFGPPIMYTGMYEMPPAAWEYPPPVLLHPHRSTTESERGPPRTRSFCHQT
ncbi:CMGC/DYRK/YAK protein kinase [Saprolegnia parasitica CBS 223.65]|uniref:CMGC/DYRK/YAK protein kinase n=1 Tax=Saprolegnia parasitica (strain CBS 223.65) TaxID=695850 RepID=A0A067CH21_SAPPC|nr:CMGC/DYRK/YAK protein kinase [Saprolegnia parasitica CBS 223.65]KDO30044.1 CMGC/DYRK/YAK protein kinase [Saprolegnia parasitica CBS 223.65]|eukprot:XP_012199225.1 CMGC/DYRK/YAK protein kinase [Saprolegnia parasitica CBS 223.65]